MDKLIIFFAHTNGPTTYTTDFENVSVVQHGIMLPDGWSDPTAAPGY